MHLAGWYLDFRIVMPPFFEQEIVQIINANRERFQVVQSARRLKNGKFFSVTDKPVRSRERASESVSSGFISLMDTLNFTNEIKWKVSSTISTLTSVFAVEYWRNRYQRMNKERFLAANAMALVTHTIVSPSLPADSL